MTDTVEICILANRKGREFLPFSGMINIPLLPLLGKPLLQHLIEMIAANAPANITVLIPAGDREVAAVAMQKCWHGVKIVARDDFCQIGTSSALMIRADVFPDATAISNAIAKIRKDGTAANIQPRADFWPVSRTRSAKEDAAASEQRFAPDLLLRNVLGYFRVHMAAEEGRFPALMPEGWIDDDGIRAGIGCKILTRRAPGTKVSIGNGAFVDEHVQLGDFVAIGKGAYVGRSAWISNSILLANSYVPPGIGVHNSVVCGTWCFNVKTGSIADLKLPSTSQRKRVA